MAAEERQVEEIRLKIQALADNELPEEEIDRILETIGGSYEYRREYAEMLRLKRRLQHHPASRVPEEWLEKAERRVSRRIGRGAGMILFIGSYLALLGYSIYTLFREPDVPLIVTVLISAMVVGFVFLLGNAIADRVRESRTDKYRGVVR